MELCTRELPKALAPRGHVYVAGRCRQCNVSEPPAIGWGQPSARALRGLPPVGRWVHTCGGYTRWNADGTVDIFKTRAMGPSSTFEVMPEGFEPSPPADLPPVLDPRRASC
jgi:hypothetical protein